MKKIVLTAVAVGFTAVAAQAQGTGDGGVTRDVWVRAYGVNAKTQQEIVKKADSAAFAVAKKVEQEQVRQAREAQAKQAQQNRHFAHVPATGAMRDYAVEGRLQEQAPAQAQQPKATTPKAKKAEHKHNFLAYVFGFEKGENESDAEWQARLYAMSMK